MKDIINRFKSLPISSKRLLSLGAVFALIIALPLFVWTVSTSKFNFNPTEKAGVGDRVNVSTDDDPAIGSVSAPVTIIEFGDLQCSFCKEFHDQTLPTILSTYQDSVRFVFRDFPIVADHPEAEIAAEGANCAINQNKYWEMSDKIFANQDTISSDNLKTWASDLGLNTEEYNACLDSSNYSQEIAKDITDGEGYGVTGTPTFFINGIKLEGSLPFANFQEIIDAELNPTSPTPTATATVPASSSPSFENSNYTLSVITTDRNPNISISPNDIVPGKTYKVIAEFSLTSGNTPVIFTINGTQIGSVNTGEPGTYTITGTFLAASTTNTFEIVISDNNKLSVTFGPLATPNSCQGTCGSNYNCQGGLYCYQGYCRNPSCPSDKTCGCATPRSSPRATSKISKGGTPTTTPRASSIPQGGITRLPSPKPTFVPTLTPVETPQSAVSQSKLADYIIYAGIGIFIIATIFLAISLLRKNP